MTARAIRVWRAVAVVVPLAAVLSAAALIALRWPRYWVWVATEQTPMTWLQSTLLVLCAAVAAGLALDAYLAERPARAPVALAAGFAFLALDERFALHERLRDGLLAPAGVRVPFLPWVGAGDFVLLAMALVGLALLPRILPLFAGDRTARALLFAGVLLAIAAVIADSFDPARLPLPVERVEQTVEELVELASSTLLLLSLVRLHLLRAGAVRDPQAAGRATPMTFHSAPSGARTIAMGSGDSTGTTRAQSATSGP